MGQDVPQNYGKLVFGYPLALQVDFDPTLESVHGLLAEGSQEREREESATVNQPRAEGSQESEESAQDEPMQNPYEQPSKRAGGTLQREGPVDHWEQQRSSSGSSEPPEEQVDMPPDDQLEQEATPTHVEADPQEDEPMGEEVVNLWEAEDPPDDEDYVVEQVTCSSISASNPCVLYEASIVCSRDETGHVEKNSSGEKINVLRDWGRWLGTQRVALRRQSIGRADWEKLCTMDRTSLLSLHQSLPWEMGRVRAYHHEERHFDAVRTMLDDCRYYWTDWMRGQGEPPGWEDRFRIDREQWSEIWHLYERDLMIQEDMEWLVEAFFTFYRKHLCRLIRENDRMWGDFCQKVVGAHGNELDQLELNTFGYDMTDPNVEVPVNKKTVIPDPEKHFSFSTKLMVWQLICTNRRLPRISVLALSLPIESLFSLSTAEKTWQLNHTDFLSSMPTINSSDMKLFTNLQAQEPKHEIYVQVTFIHPQSLVDMFGLPTQARLLMFLNIKHMMWIWKKMMMKMKHSFYLLCKWLSDLRRNHGMREV